MVTVLHNAPANVAAFRATGEVTREDYESVLVPAVDNLVKKQGSINFLLLVDTPLSNFTLGAFLEDLSLGLKHFTQWRKMAIVSESGAVNKFTDIFSYIAPGEARGFTHAQIVEATEWVSS